MAARPIWRGHLRLALVSCPVALYNARHDRSNLRFNLINPETGNRIRMITQDAETGDELQRRDLAKGYEFRKNQYLLLSNDDLDSVKVESSSVMTVEKFVDADSIDPVYYDAAYHLAPDGDAGRDIYAVLREAIEALMPAGTCVLLGSARAGTEVSLEMPFLQFGRTVRGVIQGESHPRELIPMLVDFLMQGMMPVDKLITFYPLADISRAAQDSSNGTAIKPVLRMPH